MRLLNQPFDLSKNDVIETKYLIFTFKKEPHKRTYDVTIKNKANDDIGDIKWYVPFRAYAFYVNNRFPYYKSIVMDVKCLQDVIDVLHDLMDLRKLKRS